MKPFVEAGIEVQHQPQMWTAPCYSLPKYECIVQDPGLNPFSSPDALQQLLSDRLERSVKSAKFQVHFCALMTLIPPSCLFRNVLK